MLAQSLRWGPKSKQQHLVGMQSNVENVSGKMQVSDKMTWISALNSVHISLQTPKAPSAWLLATLCDSHHVLCQTLAQGCANVQLSSVLSEEPASTLGQNSSTGLSWDLQCTWARQGSHLKFAGHAKGELKSTAQPSCDQPVWPWAPMPTSFPSSVLIQAKPAECWPAWLWNWLLWPCRHRTLTGSSNLPTVRS